MAINVILEDLDINVELVDTIDLSLLDIWVNEFGENWFNQLNDPWINP